MKLIFGNHVPQHIYRGTKLECLSWTGILNIDSIMFNWLGNNNSNMETTVKNLISYFDTEENKDRLFWTCNPLILQYCENAWVLENVYVIIDDILVKFKEEPSFCRKLNFMGAGEVLVDDSRVLR